MKNISIMIILAFMFAGCTKSDIRTASDHAKIIAMNRCLETGGVPIISPWDSTILKDCKYPPEGK